MNDTRFVTRLKIGLDGPYAIPKRTVPNAWAYGTKGAVQVWAEIVADRPGFYTLVIDLTPAQVRRLLGPLEGK